MITFFVCILALYSLHGTLEKIDAFEVVLALSMQSICIMELENMLLQGKFVLVFSHNKSYLPSFIILIF